MHVLRGLVLLCGLALAGSADAASLAAGGDGVAIDAGTFGKFTLSWPELELEGGGERLKPVEKSPAGKQAVLKYAGGAEVRVTIGEDGAITYAFSNPPANLRAYRMDMLIDFSFHEGGTWTIGDGEATPFPAAKPAQPFLFQGNATSLKLTNFESRSLLFTTPPYAYQQLQDYREWNWSIFAWMFITPFDRHNPTGKVMIREDSSEAKRVIVVDRFGQDAALEFPGKIHSLDELRADVTAEQAYYASLKPPQRDAYGGVPGSGQALGLKQTGYFHVERLGERWYLVTPEGNATFHLGICGFGPGEDYTYIKGREQVYEWLPNYDSEYKPAFHTDQYWSRDTFSFYIANQIRKYGEYDRNANLKRMVARVKQMGFNSSGAFSGGSNVYREVGFPYVSSLPLGQWTLGRQIEGLRGLFDPFDTETAAKMAELFAQSVKPQANEPLLIGYFLDNEFSWDGIWEAAFTTAPDSACRDAFVATARKLFGSVDELRQAAGGAVNAFDDLRRLTEPLRADTAWRDAWLETVSEQYYAVTVAAVRDADPNHLVISQRYAGWTPDPSAKAAGRHCDIVCMNFYNDGLAYGISDNLQRRFAELGELTGKPLLIGEWSFKAMDAGLPNTKGAATPVETQQDRAVGYASFLATAAANPYLSARTGHLLGPSDGGPLRRRELQLRLVDRRPPYPRWRSQPRLEPLRLPAGQRREVRLAAARNPADGARLGSATGVASSSTSRATCAVEAQDAVMGGRLLAGLADGSATATWREAGAGHRLDPGRRGGIYLYRRGDEVLDGTEPIVAADARQFVTLETGTLPARPTATRVGAGSTNRLTCGPGRLEVSLSPGWWSSAPPLDLGAADHAPDQTVLTARRAADLPGWQSGALVDLVVWRSGPRSICGGSAARATSAGPPAERDAAKRSS